MLTFATAILSFESLASSTRRTKLHGDKPQNLFTAGFNMRARAARGQPGTVFKILLCKQINPLMRSMKAAVLLPFSSLAHSIAFLLLARLFRSSVLSLRSMAVLSSRAQERRSREKNKNFQISSAPISSRFLCPRPPLLLSAPNQNRHATQASLYWDHSRKQ